MKLKWVAGISVFLIAGILGFIFWHEASSSSQENEENFYQTEETAVNTDNEVALPVSMSEQAVQQHIHDMSHQKVEAVPKWGRLQITPERIEGLISVVESGSYEHAHVYLDILYGWKDGDFSEADKDHNTIWRLQGGTIGKATGLLSQDEERAYVEKHFE
ncbi:DUF6241 domain-containing protein [Bacillus sp. AK031]